MHHCDLRPKHSTAINSFLHGDWPKFVTGCDPNLKVSVPCCPLHQCPCQPKFWPLAVQKPLFWFGGCLSVWGSPAFRTTVLTYLFVKLTRLSVLETFYFVHVNRFLEVVTYACFSSLMIPPLTLLAPSMKCSCKRNLLGWNNKQCQGSFLE